MEIADAQIENCSTEQPGTFEWSECAPKRMCVSAVKFLPTTRDRPPQRGPGCGHIRDILGSAIRIV